MGSGDRQHRRADMSSLLKSRVPRSMSLSPAQTTIVRRTVTKMAALAAIFKLPPQLSDQASDSQNLLRLWSFLRYCLRHERSSFSSVLLEADPSTVIIPATSLRDVHGVGSYLFRMRRTAKAYSLSTFDLGCFRSFECSTMGAVGRTGG